MACAAETKSLEKAELRSREHFRSVRCTEICTEYSVAEFSLLNWGKMGFVAEVIGVGMSVTNDINPVTVLVDYPRCSCIGRDMGVQEYTSQEHK